MRRLFRTYCDKIISTLLSQHLFSTIGAMPSLLLRSMLATRADDSAASSSLLPLWIILGIGVALAIAWFAISSCLGDNARDALAERIKGLFSRRTSDNSRMAYGRMRDDEAEAFDINAAESDLYDELDHNDSYPPAPAGHAPSKYSAEYDRS